MLAVDYSKVAELRGGRLSVVGNLPYYITSQILFCLCDHHAAVRRAVVTMQWEVAQRLVAAPRTRDYGMSRRGYIPQTNRGDAAAATWIFRGRRVAATPRLRRGYSVGDELRRRRGCDVDILRRRVAETPRTATWIVRGDRGCDVDVRKRPARASGILSVVFQLYATPKIAFKIPPTAFYPQPKVTSALVVVDFPENRALFPVDPRKLRTVITTAFQQRRKMLRQSLKPILNGNPCPEAYATRRPEELAPREFLDLTGAIFGFSEEEPDVSGKAIWRNAKLRKDGGGR